MYNNNLYPEGLKSSTSMAKIRPKNSQVLSIDVTAYSLSRFVLKRNQNNSFQTMMDIRNYHDGFEGRKMWFE